MKGLKFRLLIGLIYSLTLTTVYGQLEQVEAFYKEVEKQAHNQPITLQFLKEDTNLVQDPGRLSQIVLIRHGEPALDKKGWRKRSEAVQYIADYDSVGVYPPSFIPLTLAENEVDVIYTSSIYRSVSTAKQVFNRDDLLKPDSLFREFERKIFSAPNIKLPLKWWTTGSRILWFMGLNRKGIERKSDAKKRAQEVAAFLQQDAFNKGKTVLVSHGLLNRYVEKYLKKLGWKAVYNGGNGYLSQRMMVKYKSPSEL